MPLNRSSSGLAGASLIVINIDPDKHFIRTVGSFVATDKISANVRTIEINVKHSFVVRKNTNILWFVLDSGETEEEKRRAKKMAQTERNLDLL